NSKNIQPTDSLNATRYSNPEVDRLLNKARTMPAGTPRLELYQQAERMIMHDAPLAPLYYEVEMHLCQPYVRGARPHPVWRYLRIAQVTKRLPSAGGATEQQGDTP